MKPVATTSATIHLAMLVNMLSMGTMMMVMTLGPDLVVSLSMAPEQTGYFSGGATLGTALMGLIDAPWLDRVNRKPALLVLLILHFLLLMASALVQNSQQLLGLCGRTACSHPSGTPCPYPGPVVRLAEPLPAVWALRPAADPALHHAVPFAAGQSCPSRQRVTPAAGLPALPGRPVHPLPADIRSLLADPAFCQVLPVQPGFPPRADRRTLSVRRPRQHGHHATVWQLD